MPRNLIIRVGIDASGYTRGLNRLKRETKTASEAMAKETAAVRIDKTVAKAQPGTTVNDRVGSMLQAGGTQLITDIDSSNIREARRQLEDLAAIKTKLIAKGAADSGAAGPDVEKYWQVKGMYEALAVDIAQYDTALQEQVAAQKEAEAAAVAQAQAQESAGRASALSMWLGRASGTKYARALEFVKIQVHDTIARFRTLQATDEEAAASMSRLTSRAQSLGRGIGSLAKILWRVATFPVRTIRGIGNAIGHIGTSARNSHGGLSSMVRSIRNIGLLSVGLRIAGAAFGRLRSIANEYISSNAQLQAQVNGLKAGLGQALAPAIGMVVNLFAQLMPYVLGVANAIGSLMGALFGSAWNKAAAGASKTAAATGSAAKAQKELNNQLLGFDEITRLDSSDSDTSSGGGGGGSGVGAAAIDVKTPAWMERFKQSFTDLFSSDEFKAANIGGKLGMSLQTGLDWLGSEAMNFDWNGVGQKLRANWDSFWNSGVVESFGRTVGIVFAGIGDMVIGFLGPTWDEMGQAWKNEGWQGIAVYVGGMTLAGLGKLTSGLFTKLIAPMFQGMADYFREHGHQSLAGFFQGLADKSAKIGEDVKKYFVDPIVNWVKNLLGIHSPSTVFAGFAQNCVDGFTNKFAQLKGKITEKFTSISQAVTETVGKIKNAFNFNWQLPQLRLPHIKVDWVEAGGVLSRFLGISHIPNLSVQWFAKGGILDGAQIFGGAGGKFFGGGEAGREAVLPLDSNTGWMDSIADRVAARIESGADGDITIPIYLDGKLIATEVIKRLRSQARASGQPAAGY